MDVILYRPLVMIRNVERAFRPVWNTQNRNEVFEKKPLQILLKAAKRATLIDFKEENIIYAGRGEGPAFKRELNYLKELFPEEQFDSAKKRKNFFRRLKISIELSIKSISFLLRLIKFSSNLKKNRRLSPPEWENYLLFLVDYLVYQFYFNVKKKRPRGVVAHSLFSPRGLSLMSAAIKEKVPSLFILHGACSTSFPGITFPTFPVDLHLIKSQASYDGIKLRSVPECGLVFYGLPVSEAPFRKVPASLKTLGVCLTYAVVEEYLDEMLSQISDTIQPEKIKIRFHPRDPLGKIFFREGVETSHTSETVQDFSKNCDLVIAGNTSAILEILKIGCPVAYVSDLDTLGYDIYGFVGKQLVPGFSTVKDIDFSEILAIYDRSIWIQRMNYFDPSYGFDREEYNMMVKSKIATVLAQDPSCC